MSNPYLLVSWCETTTVSMFVCLDWRLHAVPTISDSNLRLDWIIICYYHHYHHKRIIMQLQTQANCSYARTYLTIKQCSRYRFGFQSKEDTLWFQDLFVFSRFGFRTAGPNGGRQRVSGIWRWWPETRSTHPNWAFFICRYTSMPVVCLCSETAVLSTRSHLK